MGIYVAITAFPFYWMFITAFKTNNDLYTLANNPLWFNELPTFGHIIYLFENTRFGTWMLNSAIIGVFVVLITLVIATPAGYALARLDLPGANQMGMAIFATYLVPPTLLFIPLTRVVYFLNLQNTIWSLVIVLPTISIPFAVWLLMGFFKNVPKEIEDAGLVDGCSRFQAVDADRVADQQGRARGGGHVRLRDLAPGVPLPAGLHLQHRRQAGHARAWSPTWCAATSTTGAS